MQSQLLNVMLVMSCTFLQIL